MSTTFKRLVSLFLLISLTLICVSACSSNGSLTQDSPSDESSSFSQNETEGGKVYLGYIEAIVDENGKPFDAPVYDKADETITFLSHWTPTTADSVHMVNYMKKYGGPQIKFITAPYSECRTKLQSLVLSENSPDVYKIIEGDTTGIMRQGIFTDLTELIDWDSKNWETLKPYLDIVSYNGKILIAPEFNTNYFIWFNRSIFLETGIEDPLSLYKKNEWTIDRFDSICKKLTVRSNGETHMYGFGYDHTWMRQVFAFFDAQLTTISGDHYVNTVNSSNVSDAVDYLDKMINVSKVTCPRENILAYFASGKLAMLWYGNWLSMTSPFDDMNLSGVIDFVPAPLKNSSDKIPRQDYALAGHAIPIGAKNIDAAVAFIEIFNHFKQTPDFDNTSTLTQCALKNWSYEQFLRMREPMHADNKYTFNNLSSTWSFILDSVESGYSWLSVRDMYSQQIDLVIKGIEDRN